VRGCWSDRRHLQHQRSEHNGAPSRSDGAHGARTRGVRYRGGGVGALFAGPPANGGRGLKGLKAPSDETSGRPQHILGARKAANEVGVAKRTSLPVPSPLSPSRGIAPRSIRPSPPHSPLKPEGQDEASGTLPYRRARYSAGRALKHAHLPSATARSVMVTSKLRSGEIRTSGQLASPDPC